MKKTLLSIVFIATASFAFADVDHTMEFVDKDGNIVADGSVINRTEVEEDDFGDMQIKSGLYAKNTSSKAVNIGFTITAENVPSGQFRHCFPGSCNNTPQHPELATYPIIGSVDTRAVGSTGTTIKAGETQDLQSEWILESGKYGTCTVKYQFHIYTAAIQDGKIVYTSKGDGPSVTVNYIYQDPTGINTNVAEQKLNSVSYYDLSGRKVSHPESGVYVKKMTYADGTVKSQKVAVK